MPETKGRSIEEIMAIYAGKKKDKINKKESADESAGKLIK
jgi:hypothetical protein